jgi:hypothetical protein
MENRIKMGFLCLAAFFLFTIILSVQSLAQDANKIYIVELNYNRGTITLIDVFIKDGYLPDIVVQPETGYECRLISFTNETLYGFKFEIPTEVSPPPPLENESYEAAVSLENVNFTLILPYFENGNVINIYDPDGIKVFSVDVSGYSTCNMNTICNYPYENYNSCPQDCQSGSKDGYCDGIKDGLCDPDCNFSTDMDCRSSPTFILLVSAGIIFIILLVFFVIKTGFKERK